MGPGLDISEHAAEARSTDAPTGDGPAYFPLHPGIVRAASFVPFPLYAGRSEDGRVLRILAAGRLLCTDAWEQLQRDGERLCVRQEDRADCYDYVESHLADIVADPGLPDRERARWAYRVTCAVMEGLFGDTASEDLFRRLSAIVDVLVDAVAREPALGWRMFERAPGVYSTPSHSVNVCVLLLLMATRGFGVEDRAALREVALGGILHDIGKTEVPDRILGKSGPLTSDEFALVRRHPRKGVGIGRRLLRQAPTARMIVWQHHEDADGGGYPEGTSAGSLDRYARAARVADAFDALTTRRPYGPAATIPDALTEMACETGGKFDRETLGRFIRCCEDLLGDHVQVTGHRSAMQATPAAGPPAACGPAAESGLIQAADNDTLGAARAPEGSIEARMDSHSALLLSIADALDQAVARLAASKGAGQAGTEPAAEPEGTAGPALPPAEDLSPEPDRDAEPLSGQGGDSEVEFARSLVPIVWQLDSARRRLVRDKGKGQQVKKLRADALAYLEGVRNGILRALAEHNVSELKVGQPASEPGGERDSSRARFVHMQDGRPESLDDAPAEPDVGRRKVG